MITRLSLLSVDECLRIRDTIFALREHWVPRHPTLPSYTLGLAAYLDTPALGTPVYLMRSRRLNKILEENFGDLYQRIRTTLEGHLKAPVSNLGKGGLPGFHIFLGHARLSELPPSLHFDRQHTQLGSASAAAAPLEDRLTLTISFQLPAAGGGLLIWPLSYEAYDPQRPLSEAAAALEPALHEYSLGELLLHDGNQLHQIDARRLPVEGEARVTLQGHAVRLDGTWHLYW